MNTFESVLAVVLMMGGTWWVCEWTYQRVIRRKEQDIDRYSDPGRPRASMAVRPRGAASVGRVAAGSTAAQLSERLSRRRVEVADPAAAFHFPATAHAPEKAEQLDRDSEYARGTVLSLVPKDGAA